MLTAVSATPRTGVLLVNTGSPASPGVADVRAYLRQFLSDPRVVDLPALGRWLLLNFIILPFRPRRSAHAYRQVWTARGAPLLVHGQDLAHGVQAALGPAADVVLAMRYGNPSIGSVLDQWAHAGVRRIVVVPLFPHHASASWGSAVDAVYTHASTLASVPALHVVPPFFAEPEFLDPVAAGLRAACALHAPDHVVLSYHGVPERHVRRTDLTGSHCLASPDCCAATDAAESACYRAQCMATSRLLIARAGLDPARVATAFQSRLGRTPWIGPATDAVLTDLHRHGKRKVVIAAPSFVADCLETVEELGLRARADFSADGGELVLIPCLNAQPDWCAGLASLIRRSCPWLTGAQAGRGLLSVTPSPRSPDAESPSRL